MAADETTRAGDSHWVLTPQMTADGTIIDPNPVAAATPAGTDVDVCVRSHNRDIYPTIGPSRSRAAGR